MIVMDWVMRRKMVVWIFPHKEIERKVEKLRQMKLDIMQPKIKKKKKKKKRDLATYE